ncbi:MAG: hypothetical protein JNK24_01705 [Alphaproteobacteria bacterium]|nr:hypothetical protein [Alphaproteobacteria bacterium]
MFKFRKLHKIPMPVRQLGLILSAIIAMMGGPGTAQAEERYMTLWPNQRASHQADIETDAEKYHARGQSYVDHLYDTGGESDITDPDDLHEMDLELYPAALQPVDVDINEVAGIVKASGQGEVIENPAPLPKEKAATKLDPKAESKTELKTEPTTEPKTDPKVEIKPDAKNESASDPEDSKTEVKTDIQNSAAVKSVPESEPKAEASPLFQKQDLLFEPPMSAFPLETKSP